MTDISTSSINSEQGSIGGGKNDLPESVYSGAHTRGSGSSGWRPSEEQINQYCQFLGMDPEVDKQFKYIAEDALTAPIPPPWKEFETPDGYVYYVNNVTGKSSWEHPLDSFYRQMYKEAKYPNEKESSKGAVDPKLLKEKEEEVQKVKKELDAVRRDFEDLSIEKTKLAKRLAEISSSNEKTKELNVSYKKQLENLRTQHSELTSTIASTAKDKSKDQKKILTLEESVMTLTEKIGSLEEEALDASSKCDQLRSEIKEKSEKLAQAEAKSSLGQKEMQAKLESLKQSIEEHKDTNSKLTMSLELALKEKDEAKEEASAALDENKKLTFEIEEETGKVENLEAELKRARARLERLDVRYIAKEKETKETLAKFTTKCNEYNKLQAEKEDFERRVKVLSQLTSDGLHEDHGKALEEVTKLAMRCEEREAEVKKAKAELVKVQTNLAELQASVAKVESERREALNRLQDIQGNIRVMCRVRPLLNRERRMSVYAAKPGMQKTINCTPTTGGVEILEPHGKAHEFNFNHVFHDSSQEEVFDEVSTLVQSALDGYNVCLFAYGQTGSGKTYTMQGDDGKNQGVIPRAVQKILEAATAKKVQGWEFEITASFLEIYNEQVRDLLEPKNTNLEIKMVKAGQSQTYVPGLKKLPISSRSDITNVMDTAAKNRSVAATDMNADSSRSHSVFTLYMKGRNPKLRLETKSALYLCDLAGSERVDKSGVEGARLKEAVMINKSLSALSDVFQALARRDSHVPFRNSKLTYLLQCCFVGNGKTLMFVNLSPSPNSLNESLCSLRFAQRVNKCVMGPAQIQASKLSGSPTSKKHSGISSARGSGKTSKARSPSGRSATKPPPGSVPRYARSSKSRARASVKSRR
mmetsp:Transcript_30786/g.75060  ORF Transcript_30786/g.75060 Transcript_30786/m.75060 type:complete len:870 (+) Transcript_30786:150-2759(+)